MFLALARIAFFFCVLVWRPSGSLAAHEPQRVISLKCNEGPTDPLRYPGDTLQGEYGTVIFSSMLFRHGSRNRVFRYPTDQRVEFYKSKGWGLLTRTGKCQIYDLGRWARARYMNILEVTPYDSDVVHVLSTLSDRTISSAQIFVTGFYPPTTDNEIWNEALDWQPIPVYSTPKEMDKMLLLEKYCPRYNMEMIMNVNNAPEIREFYQKHERVFTTVRDEAKVPIPEGDFAKAINQLVHMRDNFIIDERFGFKPPAWGQEFYPEILREVTLKFYEIQTYNDKMKRLKGGLLVKNIIDDMVRARDDPESRKKFQIYSGHDTTIAVLLRTLGAFDNLHPPYGAMVLIELRLQGDDNYIVTVMYKKPDEAHPKLLNIPDCSNPCTLKKFMKVTFPIIPSDWEAECQDLGPDYNTILF